MHNNDDPTGILNEVAEMLDNESELVKLERYLRRIGRALSRLGVLSVVGDDWVRIDSDGQTISFAPIPRDKLLLFAGDLEYRVDELINSGMEPAPIQLRFDLDLSPLVVAPAIRPHLGGTA
jgi:hypothetical protein